MGQWPLSGDTPIFDTFCPNLIKNTDVLHFQRLHECKGVPLGIHLQLPGPAFALPTASTRPQEEHSSPWGRVTTVMSLFRLRGPGPSQPEAAPGTQHTCLRECSCGHRCGSQSIHLTGMSFRLRVGVGRTGLSGLQEASPSLRDKVPHLAHPPPMGFWEH